MTVAVTGSSPTSSQAMLTILTDALVSMGVDIVDKPPNHAYRKFEIEVTSGASEALTNSRIANVVEYIMAAMRIKLGTVKSAMIHECNISSSFDAINSRYTDHSHIKLLAWKEDAQ
jgi:hypothetical protein